MSKGLMNNPHARHIDFKFMEGLILENPKWLGCNIDMCCERNGKFLFGEWKHPNEPAMKKGQLILLERLSKNPNCIVLFIDGYSSEDDIEVNKVVRCNGRKRKEVGNSIKDLQRLIKEFYKWADQEMSVVPNKF